MIKLAKALKILTAVSALTVIIPGDKWSLCVGIIAVLHILVSPLLYKFYTSLVIGSVVYILISGINNYKSKADSWIIIILILFLNSVLAIIIKSVLTSNDITIITLAFLFIGLSLSTLFQSVKMLRKLS